VNWVSSPTISTGCSPTACNDRSNSLGRALARLFGGHAIPQQQAWCEIPSARTIWCGSTEQWAQASPSLNPATLARYRAIMRSNEAKPRMRSLRPRRSPSSSADNALLSWATSSRKISSLAMSSWSWCCRPYAGSSAADHAQGTEVCARDSSMGWPRSGPFPIGFQPRQGSHLPSPKNAWTWSDPWWLTRLPSTLRIWQWSERVEDSTKRDASGCMSSHSTEPNHLSSLTMVGISRSLLQV
jgi:hypothetical protein